ncbi:MAG: lipase maturation factor family protein [Acidobacteriota bacterium]|nr:lipase maturation factor family protein [Acidobacteriota bacterium]
MNPLTSGKPVLVFDGDCSFCRLWIDRWRQLTDDRIQYAPFQEVAGQFPEILRETFALAVQLILPDGKVFSAAHAVFHTLALVPGLAWMLWLYQHLPGFAFITEFFYRFVARHRNPLYRLTRILWGKHFERPSFSLATWLFLRLLGVTYFFAFLSLATQVSGLIGGKGILPAAQFLAMVSSRVGPERYWLFPTLAWLSSSDAAFHVISVGGVIGSLLLIFDIAPALVLSLLWMLYLSLVTVGQDFLSFQWDNLLLEAGFLALFIAPWHLWPLGRSKVPPPRIARWMLWFLLFRLMFSSGVVKLTSGDTTWRNLTALDYHYYTQPLPTSIAWYVHLAPPWFHHGSVVFVLFIELAVPFLIFAPRLWRFAGGGILILLQLLIALTGNYAFFNLLAIALCVLLFDDAALSRFFPRVVADRMRVATNHSRRFSVRRWVTVPILLVIFAAGLLQLADLFAVQWLPPPAFQFLAELEPVRVVNGYGLFAVMTTSRPEIIIEGSNDGNTWREYEFKFKPGDLRRAPRWVAPLQPRLDWQMWFAALGDYRSSPWFSRLLLRLLEGSPPVLALFERNPFPQSPPRYVRALIYDYQFTTWSERRVQGEWWQRRLLGGYFPAVTLNRSENGETH